MSFASKGVVPPDAAFALVPGANLGTAINPVLEGGAGTDNAARRLPIGNLINRTVGVVAALTALPVLGRWLVTVDPDNARVVADFHTGFNLILALVFFPLLTPYASLLRRLLPVRVNAAEPGRPMYLDPAAVEVPMVALGAATREALRMADALEAMLQGLREALQRPDRRRLGELKRLDDVLDTLNTAIKVYMTALPSEAMTESDHRRVVEILCFATNLEHAGDVVDKGLLGVIAKQIKRDLIFAPAEAESLLHLVEPPSIEPALGRCPASDRRRSCRPPDGGGKGSVPGAGGRGHRGAFRTPARGQGGQRGNQRPEPGRAARHEASERASGRRRSVSGIGK
jgi:phosphate:Na+ symporter